MKKKNMYNTFQKSLQIKEVTFTKSFIIRISNNDKCIITILNWLLFKYLRKQVGSYSDNNF